MLAEIDEVCSALEDLRPDNVSVCCWEFLLRSLSRRAEDRLTVEEARACIFLPVFVAADVTGTGQELVQMCVCACERIGLRMCFFGMLSPHLAEVRVSFDVLFDSPIFVSVWQNQTPFSLLCQCSCLCHLHIHIRVCKHRRSS